VSRDDPALDALLARIRACRVCVEHPRGAPLPHVPRPVLRVSESARILIASQAPGTKVHASGLPFTDASGERLRDWMGVSKDEFYDVARIAIAPMGFCFPGQDAKGGDLPPRRECAVTWHESLFAALPAFPVVLAVGRPAQLYHLRRLGLGALAGGSLSETVANWRAIIEARPDVRVWPLPHPSWRNTGWIRRHPFFEAELLPALKADIRRALGKE